MNKPHVLLLTLFLFVGLDSMSRVLIWSQLDREASPFHFFFFLLKRHALVITSHNKTKEQQSKYLLSILIPSKIETYRRVHHSQTLQIVVEFLSKIRNTLKKEMIFYILLSFTCLVKNNNINNNKIIYCLNLL